jgi:farnesyl diphosphate synthase
MFEQRLMEVSGLVEQRMGMLLDGELLGTAPARLRAAMRHAALAGGKRFRPFLVLESARLFGLRADQAIDAAVAIECVHAYSLAHDDLPAMDNDELRRGQPTVWKAFDEATAILAGDALLTVAFEILARQQTHPNPAVRAELVLGLARSSGASGMAGGQQLDLDAESGRGQDLHTAAGVARIHRMKTAALIAYSAQAGAVLAEAPALARHALAVYGNAMGEAFQIADDLLDAEGDAHAVGKNVRKDAAAGKATSVSTLGVAGARARLLGLEADAIAALEPFGATKQALADAVSFVVRRRR